MARHTCFVISPIGAEGSETRREADETFELVIKPSLPADFRVERADQIVGISDTITREMVERIQHSDLCIVDLTGRNPNVMYECGRRHETGKPTIMISQDDELPFDVVTHPVIKFSLDASGRELVPMIQKIRQEVEHYLETGFDRLTETTNQDLAAAIARVSSKIDTILRQRVDSGTREPESHGDVGVRQLIRDLGGVVPATNYAFAERDAALLDVLLPMGPNKTSPNFILAGLVQGVYVGSSEAWRLMEQYALPVLPQFSVDDQVKIVAAYAFGAARLDEEERALGFVEAFANDTLAKHEGGDDIDLVVLAKTTNAVQRLYHALGRYDMAVAWGRRTLEYCPNDPSFLYNQALNQMGREDLEAAEELVDRYMADGRLTQGGSEGDVTDDGKPDDDHLALAIKVYLKMGRKSDAMEAFALLSKHYPLQAQIVRNDADFESLFE